LPAVFGIWNEYLQKNGNGRLTLKRKFMTDDVKDGFDFVFRGSQIDAALISQFLNNNEIETFINNQLMGTIAP